MAPKDPAKVVEILARAVIGSLGGITVINELYKTKAFENLFHFCFAKETSSQAGTNAKPKYKFVLFSSEQLGLIRRVLLSQISRGIKASVLIALLRVIELKLSKLLQKSKFPGALAGMVLLSVILMVLEPVLGGFGLNIATVLQRLALPGCEFLMKWMPLFFVPGLITLPLAVSNLMKSNKGGATSSLIKSLIIIIIGFVLTLLSSANIAKMTSISPAMGGSSLIPSGASPNGATTPSTNALGSQPIRLNYDAIASIIAGGLTLIFACMKSKATPLLTSFTALSYIWGTKLPASLKTILHPVLVCGILTSGLTNLLPKSAGDFVARNSLYSAKAGHYWGALLGPSLFALAFNLYATRKVLFANLKPILSSSIWSSVSALVGTAVAARVLRISPKLAASILPRTATTALGVAMSKILTDDESMSGLTILSIVLSGLLSANFGKQILTNIGFSPKRYSLVRGISMGAAGHGLATASLAADGEIEASSIAAVTLVLCGAIQTVLVSIPAVRKVLLATCGMIPVAIQ